MGFFFFASRAAARFLDEVRLPSGVSTAALLLTAASGGGLVAYADSRTGIALDPSQQDAPERKKVVVLGTGWAATSFLKNLDCSRYEVKVVSPRNYFGFTPLLPSVTCGTVEPRSIIEPIRKMFEKKKKDVTFYEAECFKIDATKKAVHCRSSVGTNLDGNGDFIVDFDYLVVALGATVNTFNTPGVTEHCYFLKEVEDAQKIRRSMLDSFEKASLPNITEEEKRKMLHFVIVGGGPTGVEFAAELHDFLVEDLVKLYPAIQEFVKITIIQSGEHILNMFDQRIAAFAEMKFMRDGIHVLTGFRVVKVSDDLITMKSKSLGEISVPYGMAVWSAGIGTRPVIMDFMHQIGQANRRALATNEWLRVRECDGVYAIGDCASISQRKIMEDISTIFKIADKDNTGTLTLKEIYDILEDICIRYPQVELYMKSMHMLDIADLIESAIGDSLKESMEVDIEQFKKALGHVDSQVKSVPATAQVAAQQGYYLADCLNKLDRCKEQPEGPLRLTESGRHNFLPFRYKHFGQFAPLGGEQAAAELPGDWVSIGQSTQWLWYSVYASKQVSWRTKDSGSVRLGSQIHIWQGLKPAITPPKMQGPFCTRKYLIVLNFERAKQFLVPFPSCQRSCYRFVRSVFFCYMVL